MLLWAWMAWANNKSSRLGPDRRHGTVRGEHNLVDRRGGPARIAVIFVALGRLAGAVANVSLSLVRWKGSGHGTH